MPPIRVYNSNSDNDSENNILPSKTIELSEESSNKRILKDSTKAESDFKFEVVDVIGISVESSFYDTDADEIRV